MRVTRSRSPGRESRYTTLRTEHVIIGNPLRTHRVLKKIDEKESCREVKAEEEQGGFTREKSRHKFGKARNI